MFLCNFPCMRGQPARHTCLLTAQHCPLALPRLAGVDGLLGILLEDSLEGYVACTVFGFAIGTLIRTLKLPVVEGGGMGPF